ncbi:hypothetical protein Pmar_PMAR022654 [Perkinsus marinus ATCC 50983]|uniref:Uncharacterized protein n=1 Tax=Perkinsus marinus (strain ATCC 50983 / TXsc) TaxID=423536 RepID=C5L9K4_PERM5|nr:hypothetical protein Pmar_PMAR022654 [Perkinsus marinus ATCC 50983]EER06597.1 hypothetical protein Pmar_PMAR022654 [Perkinsus marinus ATCC 50983]|eukprot:XP_002774781.1 hypothetical protein Pmar_PMAR022654 [Perkinsus marinus ATCC 50983]
MDTTLSYSQDLRISTLILGILEAFAYFAAYGGDNIEYDENTNDNNDNNKIVVKKLE